MLGKLFCKKKCLDKIYYIKKTNIWKLFYTNINSTMFLRLHCVQQLAMALIPMPGEWIGLLLKDLYLGQGHLGCLSYRAVEFVGCWLLTNHSKIAPT